MGIQLILDLAFVCIAAVIIIISAKRGFIANLVHSCRWILSFVAAYLFGPSLGGILNSAFIGNAVRGFVYGRVDALYQSASESFGAEQIAEKLPAFLLTDKVRAELDGMQGSGTELVNSVTDTVATPIATLISNILGYIGVFLIALLVLWFAVKLVNGLLDKITLLGAVNHVLGCVWGILLASLLLFMLSSAVKLFLGGTEWYQSTVIVKFFGDSALLQTLKILDIGSAWFR